MSYLLDSNVFIQAKDLRLSCCFRGSVPAGERRAAAASGEHGHGDERLG